MPESLLLVATGFYSITERINHFLYPKKDEPAPNYAELAADFDARASAARSDGDTDKAVLWEDGADEARRLLAGCS